MNNMHKNHTALPYYFQQTPTPLASFQKGGNYWNHRSHWRHRKTI